MKVPELDKTLRVQVIEGEWSPKSVIQDMVSSGAQEDPFYVMDLGEVVARYHRWKELMPRVEPFYAVKCNDDKVLVSTLAALGAGFDCASKTEMELVTDLGVAPERIIFANPAKMSSHIRRADALGVQMMTFDSEIELMKIKQLMPHAQLVVRIRCDAEAAQCPLGMKFGCDPVTEAPRLLKLAALHRLNVVGISFHVGSGAGEVAVYGRAIQLCRSLHLTARKLGLDASLIDLGGGYPGGTNTDIRAVSECINSALETYFPEEHVRVIAEPGRYFAAAAYTLATLVHSVREIKSTEEGKEDHTMYFINDGVYGSFNCVLYDHQTVHAEPLQGWSGKPSPCSVWGPSCDGLDCVVAACRLPRLAGGAWLVWRDMGAYTLPVASPFNGFPVPAVTHLVDGRLWSILKDVLPLKPTDYISEPYCVASGSSSPLPSPDSSPDSTPSSPPLSPAGELHHAVFVECALK